MFLFDLLDIVSPPITLFYRGKSQHSSIPGLLISLFSIVFLTVVSIIISLDFFFKKNPNAYTYKRYIEDAGTFYFNSSRIFHFVTFGEDIEKFIYDKKAFSLIGVSKTDNVILENNNEEYYDHWIYDSCEGEIDANETIKYIKENGFLSRYNKAFCIKQFYNSTTKETIDTKNENFKYPSLAHGNSNQKEILYGIFLQRCQNNTLKNYICYDNETIDSLALTAFSYSIYFLEQYIDINNYENPLVHFFYRLTNHINKGSYTINHLNFHPALVITYNGIIFEDHYEIETYIYDTNEKFVTNKDESNSNIYAMFYFWLQNQQDVYIRRYKLFQDICGSIGGIIKFIMVIGSYLNLLFHNYILYNDLNDDIIFRYKKITKYLINTHSIYLTSNNVLINNPKLNNNDKNEAIKLDSLNFGKKNSNNNHNSNERTFISNHYSNNIINNNINIVEDFSGSHQNFQTSKKTNKKKKMRSTRRNSSKILEYFSPVSPKINNKKSPYYGYNKIHFFDLLKSMICFWKKSKEKKKILNLVEFRKNIVSEEGMFSFFYFQSAFSKMVNEEDKK
jgi:hypothetical protein